MKISELEQRFEHAQPGTMGALPRFAVLVPLVEKDGEAHILFEVRSQYVDQPGEVCFPGGHMEPGETPDECALRETVEELGIPISAIRPIARLDKLAGGKGVVYPLLAQISAAAVKAQRPAPGEVRDTFLVPADFFVQTPPKLYRFPLIPDLGEEEKAFHALIGHPEGYPWRKRTQLEPVWVYEGHTIWGLTGRILLWNFRRDDWK